MVKFIIYLHIIKVTFGEVKVFIYNGYARAAGSLSYINNKFTLGEVKFGFVLSVTFIIYK